MMRIPVQTPSHSYEVVIGSNHLTEAVKSLEPIIEKADQLIVFTDENVWAAHEENFKKKFPYDFKVNVLAAGEACKTFESYFAAQTFLLEQKCTRKSMLFAFGGGAVGDLTGYVAATFMRGIPFVQIPTTILAHDSAVGGKTAINHPLGKNMIGAFYQPEAVLYDIDFLQTLPEKEVRSGMAEAIKHALISDEAWYREFLTKNITQLTQEELALYLQKGITVKANIVSQDEHEQSVRKYLNFGHTYGHAIEAASGYGNLAHGEAIVIGMVYALLLGEQHSDLDRQTTLDFLSFAKASGYSFEPVHQFSFEQLLPYLMTDKKAEYGILQFVLLEKIGQPFVQKVTVEQCREIDAILRTII